MRKYFLSKFTSYSLLSAISQFSLFLLCVGIICWFVLIFCAHLCFVFCLWFLWFWVRRTGFRIGCIFPWNVIVLFSCFHLMSISLTTIYNRVTSFFQVNRDQVKCMKKYFLCKFHSNSAKSHRSLCLLCYGIIFWLYVRVIEFI